jgi:hypothetical protein
MLPHDGMTFPQRCLRQSIPWIGLLVASFVWGSMALRQTHNSTQRFIVVTKWWSNTVAALKQEVLYALERWDREFESHWRHKCLCVRLFCVYAVLCVSSGLATGWSLVQGVLPSMQKRLRNCRRGQGPTKGCEVIDEWNELNDACYLEHWHWSFLIHSL